MKLLTRLFASPLLPAAVFIGAGLTHFWRPQVFESIVPAWAGDPHRAVLVSGVAELLGGLGLLLPATRPAARLGLVALLLAVWPANIEMALRARDFPDIPAWIIWLRLPLQLPLIWWVWRCGLSSGTAKRPFASLKP